MDPKDLFILIKNYFQLIIERSFVDILYTKILNMCYFIIDGVEVVVYEKEYTVGGHAKTVAVDSIVVDLGFRVFSRVTCPDMMQLFESLGVDKELSDMSFSVSLDEGQGCEWGTRNGLSSLFAQKKNVVNPCFWKMIREIIKFKDDAATYLEELENNPNIDRNDTLGHFVQSHGYSELFQKAFLIPTCASIWSCSSEVMSFSAYSTLSFLCNHHTLELIGHPQRLTPTWRSQNYVSRVKKELESRGCQIRTNSEIYSVLTNDEGCAITCKNGSEEVYDGCIIATHAPDALKIDIFLHHDNNLMPKNPAAWSSRNFLGTIDNKAYTTYWLNNIQWSTSHPIPSVAASKASSELNLIQGKRRLWFCGAYQGYGFPEDGVKSNELFSLFLDETMTYTCAIFQTQGEDLKNAQLRKTHILIEKARINKEHHILEFGCGWGNLALEVVKRTGCKYTGITLSEKQLQYVELKVKEAGLQLIANFRIKLNFFYARQNISQHYDLSNELFSLFLDETMTYSCAIFQSQGEDLKNAQLRKIRMLIEKARINKEHHILEIGCGWGSLAFEVVKRTGCKYTGITLGMIESVGHEFMEEFFRCCESALAENGLLVLQFISIADEKYDESRLSPGFIKEYIFPGGSLLSLSRVISAMAAASRLSVVHLEEIGSHYFDTLRRWRQNFLQNQSQVLALGFDEKFIRTWEYYFDYCAAGFKFCILGDYQIVFSRPGDVAFGNDPYNAVPSAY
ncbi:hypothetical protein Pfo_026470 [Paulownia fortunei]|nr:hypothetical protein Pfo_026470 [Paulownia fortunei]